jgi:hypothetical protein
LILGDIDGSAFYSIFDEFAGHRMKGAEVLSTSIENLDFSVK